jgi:cytochrome c oxidase subunit 2
LPAVFVLTAACSGGSAMPENVPVVKMAAQQWSFSPSAITLQKGVAVDLELTSNDVHHGFNLPDFNVRADVVPGKTVTVRITPNTVGTFLFHCDYYCGSGHEGMSGQIVVQ